MDDFYYILNGKTKYKETMSVLTPLEARLANNEVTKDISVLIDAD